MEITALILLIFGTIISLGITSKIRYALGMKSDGTTDESAILFELVTIKVLKKYSQTKNTPNMMLTDILKRRHFVKAFGLCGVCNNFWISILVAVVLAVASYNILTLFWCVVLSFGIVALSHLIINNGKIYR